MNYCKPPSRRAGLHPAARIAVCAAAAFMAPAHAEPMFVIDKVLINVYNEPNQESGRVATIETGDSVEAIDELDPYIQVRLPNGKEGWVRRNYLSRQPPAIVRLKELQSGQPAPQQGPSPDLVQELEALKKQRVALEGEIARMHQQAAAKPVPPPAPVAAAKPEPRQQATSSATAPNAKAEVRSRMWAWFAATVTAGALGFLLGYQTLATRIKRKYGNIKIY